MPIIQLLVAIPISYPLYYTCLMTELVTGTYLFNIGINVFSLVVLSVIYWSNRKNTAQTYDMVLFSDVLSLFMLCAIFDIFSWMFNGTAGPAARTFVYIANICFMMLETLSFGIWLLYTDYRLHKTTLNSTQKCWFLFPFLLVAILLIMTPQHKIFFTIDINNYYHRTNWTDVMSMFQITLLLISSFNALKQRNKEILPDRRNECLTLSVFIIPILIGGLLQFFLFGISLLIPFGTLSILIVDLNLKGQKILQDALTGLNNRGAMDRYILVCSEDSKKQTSSFGVLMIDVDHFKNINDSCGHPVGDQALIVFADAIRQACKNSRCFMCRYGGDEFTIIAEDISCQELKQLEINISDFIDQRNRDNKFPIQLKASIGSAYTEMLQYTSLNELMRIADRNLYASKRLSRIELVKNCERPE